MARQRRRRRRLNAKLLAILAGATAVLVLGLYLAVNYYLDNPERAVARAEAYEAAGEFDAAAGQWEKAYRFTDDPQYRLRGVRATSMRTSDPEVGDDRLAATRTGLATLVGSTDDPRAVRALLRFLASDPYFLYAGGITYATREVADKADLLLARAPEDAEARILDAAATLALAPHAGSEITPEQAQAAEAVLREALPVRPLDGTGLLAMQQLFGREYGEAAGGVVANARDNPDRAREALDDAAAVLAEFEGLVDAAAAAVGQAEPREDVPTDRASLLSQLGRSYAVLARAAQQQAQMAFALDAAAADEEGAEAADGLAQIRALNEARQAAAAPYEEQAAAAHEAAVAALDVDRDAMSQAYYEVRIARADFELSRGRPDAAEAEVRAVLDARPWDTNAALVLAAILTEQGKAAEALEVARTAYAKRSDPLPPIPGNAGAAARQARTQSGLLLADALLADLEARGAAGERVDTAAVLAEAEKAMGVYDAARVAADRQVAPQADRVRGQMQLVRGDTAAGVATLSEALGRAGDLGGALAARERPRLLRLLAAASRTLGQTGGEIDYLQQLDRDMRPAEALRLARLLAARDRPAEQGRPADRDRARDIAQRLADLGVAPDAARLLLSELGEGQDYDQLPEATLEERRFKATVALRSNRAEEAKRLLRGLVAEAPDAENAQQVAVFLARLLAPAAQGGDEAARAEVAALAARFPDNPDLSRLSDVAAGDDEGLLASLTPGERLLAESRGAMRNGDLPLAADKLREYLAADPEGDQARAVRQSLFEVLLQARRLDEAEALGEELAERGADGVGGETYRVRVRLARGETEAALRSAEALARRYPQLAAVQALLGESLRLSNQAAEAAVAYRRAIDLSPNEPAYYRGAALALLADNRAGEAKPVIDRGLELAPNDPSLTNALAQYEMQFGDPEAVVADRRAAAEAAGPDEFGPRMDLARTLAVAAGFAARRDDAEAARRFADETVAVAADALQGDFADRGELVPLMAGVAGLASPQALDRLDAVLAERMVPTAEPSLVGDRAATMAAAAYYAAAPGGRPDRTAEAEALMRRYLAATGGDREAEASVAVELAGLLVEQDKVAQAVSVLDEYDDLPLVRDRKVRMLAGAALQGRLTDALPQIRDAVAAATQGGTELSTEAASAAALVELRLGEVDRATELVEAAREDAPEDAGLLFLAGVAETRRAEPDLERAEDLLTRSAEASPMGADALRALAQVRRQRGDRDGSAEALRQLLDRRPDDVAARLALVRMALAETPPDFAAADREFGRVDRYPRAASDPNLMLARADMELRRGDTQGAVRLLERVVGAALQIRLDAGQSRPEAVAAAQSDLSRVIDLMFDAGAPAEAGRFADRLAAEFADGQAPWWLVSAQAKAAARQGQKSRAEQLYDQALGRTGGSGQATEAVTVDLAREVGFEPAYELIRGRIEGVEPAQADPLALLVASRLLAGEGRNGEALERLRQARANLDAAGRLGEELRVTLELQEGTLLLGTEPPDLDGAIAAFRRVLERQPNSTFAKNNLAYALTLAAEREGASEAESVELLREAEALGQESYEVARRVADARGEAPDPNITDTFSFAQLLLAERTGDDRMLEAAVRRLRDLRARVEGDPQEDFAAVYYHLGRALRASGDSAGAEEAVRAGLDLIDRRREAGGDFGRDRQVEASLLELQKAL